MATKSQKKSTGTSLALFKAWLTGIEEMQGDDWHPDANQWKRIKEKLMSVEEPTAPEAEPHQYRPPVMNYQQPDQFYAPAPPMPPMPQMNSAMQTANPTTAGTSLPGVRTPDIDSSGGYKSSLV